MEKQSNFLHVKNTDMLEKSVKIPFHAKLLTSAYLIAESK